MGGGPFRASRAALAGAVRTRVLALLMCAVIALFAATAGRAQMSRTPQLTADIPPQSLVQALTEFARQTGLQLVYVSGVITDQRSGLARAGLSAEDALKHLLKGTGLEFKFLNKRSIRVLSANRPQSPQQPSGQPSDAIEEVVITAHVLNEAATPISTSQITWTADAMDAAHIKDIATLANLSPGLQFNSYPDVGAGFETSISIRGINARDGSSTAVYINNTPIPTDRLSVFGRVFPVTFDMARVDVLRGPQGVLMGEGAEGGALRFVTTQPSLTTSSGFAHSEYSTTAGGGPSYEVGAALGGPIATDTLGFRIGAWWRQDGGYVDRVETVTGSNHVETFTGTTLEPNANSARREMFRAAFLISPVEAVLITPAVQYQSVEVNDTSAFYLSLSDPQAGALRNGKLLEQWYTDTYTLPSLNVSTDFDGSSLTLDTAGLIRHANALYDAGNDLAAPGGIICPCYYPAPELLYLGQNTWSTQIQLSSDYGARVSWFAGAGYVLAHYTEDQNLITAAASDRRAQDSKSGLVTFQNRTSQLEMHGEVDAKATERLKASLGWRLEGMHYEFSQQVKRAVGSSGNDAGFSAFNTGSSTVAAPRLGFTFQASEDQLYYATVAKGYRMGGPNHKSINTLDPVCQGQQSYGPDSVWNFELGAKNLALEGRLQIEGSLFHMVWESMQTSVSLPACQSTYTTNAGRAVSDGFDLNARISAGRLTFTVLAAYANARYTSTVFAQGTLLEGLQEIVVKDGDAIGTPPLVPSPWTATAIAEYQFPLRDAGVVVLRAQDAFASRNSGPFDSNHLNALEYQPALRADPSTNQLDLSVRASKGSFDVSLFLNNALDSQPILQTRSSGDLNGPFYATTLRPRTVGLAATWHIGSHIEN